MDLNTFTDGLPQDLVQKIQEIDFIKKEDLKIFYALISPQYASDKVREWGYGRDLLNLLYENKKLNTKIIVSVPEKKRKGNPNGILCGYEEAIVWSEYCKVHNKKYIADQEPEKLRQAVESFYKGQKDLLKHIEINVDPEKNRERDQEIKKEHLKNLQNLYKTL